ncbi:MAG: hypothetical protein PUG93_02555 [Oscillospiraceae bacterium]|nr:hypothetical protein [Oscillospiraceae bacterium]MDD7354003.1 hypothetical protein [Oscillospiraceae bacterium]MDY3938199.1 hypothetical protein [Oscillospiraceae bacterium]
MFLKNITVDEAADIMKIIKAFLGWVYQVLCALGLGHLMDGITDRI